MAYFERISATAFRATGHALAPDVQTWLASPEQGVKAAIESVHGAEATIDALAGLAPSGLTVEGAVVSEDTCWAEIARRSEGEPETNSPSLALRVSVTCRPGLPAIPSSPPRPSVSLAWRTAPAGSSRCG